MKPARVSAQGDDERRLWLTVLRPAAIELAERATELSDVVPAYTKERLPYRLDNVEALEANRADFAEVLSSGVPRDISVHSAAAAEPGRSATETRGAL